MNSIKALPGRPLPLGASVEGGGVNFSIFSHNAASVTLELYAGEKDDAPAAVYPLDPRTNRTGDLWHIFLEGLMPGALYLYRADGPFDPGAGMRFNKNALLLDPYAKALTRQSVTAATDWPGMRPLDRS